ncbi:MAG: XRE family transcriptional regulator [Gammaproteobacteria bacterium]
MHKAINADTLRAALAEQGLTQKQLADNLGVSSQAVTNWLKGKDFPRPATLLKLATSLRLTFEELVNAGETNRPIVAFRKKGGAKTTRSHITKAESIGHLLKPLTAYLTEQWTLRTRISSASTEYDRLQVAVSQTRSHLGIGERAVLEYEHLIGEFRDSGAVLVPVLWGEKGNHENALHIRLPKEDITFIFLNLDTRLEDFKFWLAHELAHVYTPELAGSEEGEDYADAFAGALLFPEKCVADAYREALGQPDQDGKMDVLLRHSAKHMISLNTVYQQVKRYVRAAGLPPLEIEEKEIHVTRNTTPGPLVSALLFDPSPPEPERYIADCENVFQSDFFQALKRMIKERDTGPGYIQQIMDLSLHDATALHEELSR